MRPALMFSVAVLSFALVVPLVCPAQSYAASGSVRIPLTVEKGVPLQIMLVSRVPIKRAGIPVEGRLAAPIYVYDREVLSSGTRFLGRVTSVRGMSRWRRARALMSGDFTPWRTAQVTFDTVILKDGRRLPISTLASEGIPQVVRLESSPVKKAAKGPVAKLTGRARQQVNAEKQQMVSLVGSPGKLRRIMDQLKAIVVERLPYHGQAFQPGTEFTAQLQRPLALGMETVSTLKLAKLGSAPSPDSVVHARLVTPLNSAAARRGMPVQAVVTQPLFAAHQLVIPQGSRLEGTVVRDRPARWLHRDGSLRFTFQRLEPPASKPQAVQASLQAVMAPRQANLTLGPEGGVRPKTSRTRYLLPALSLTMAAWVATPDRDAVNAQAGAAIPSQGGAVGQVMAGGWGLGLLGSVVLLAAQSRILSTAFGFYGAAGSVYTNILARGHDVVFPANTPIEIRLGNHERPASKLKLPADGALIRRG